MGESFYRDGGWVYNVILVNAGHKRIHLLVAVIDLYGGTGAFCRSLVGGLKAQFPGEFEITLLLMGEKGLLPGDRELVDHLTIIGRAVHTGWRRAPETLLHAMRLRRAVKAAGADLAFTIGTFMNLLLPTVAPGLPTIISAHTDLTHQLAGSRWAAAMRALVRLGYKRNLLVAPCEGVARDMRDHYGARRTAVILHGVDAAAIRAMALRTPDDLPQSPYMIAVGRLTDQKDYPTLLRAYAIAARQGVAEELVVLGEGEDRRQLEQLANSLGVGQRLHFLGHRENPWAYMKRARFFVLSSKWEGFGLVILEAMALGLPVVATDCPSGPGEILAGGRYGLLTPPGEVALLADAIVKLSSSAELRERLSAAATARAGELGVGQMVRRYRDLVRSPSFSLL